jgi:hypothetical protein
MKQLAALIVALAPTWKTAKSSDKPAVKTEGDGNKITQAK